MAFGATRESHVMDKPMFMHFLLLLLLASHTVSAHAGDGPCSQDPLFLNVTKVQDLQGRLKYSANQTVHVVLLNDLELNTSIILNNSFSCTIFTSKSNSNYSIKTTQDSFPAVYIQKTNNILIQNVNFEFQNRNPLSPTRCNLASGIGRVCPLIYITDSWGVQIVQASNITGRIDIWRSANITIDSISIKAVKSDYAGITVQAVGSGPNLIRGDIWITNNVLTGGMTGVILSSGAVGCTVANNAFYNQYFAAIQLGFGVHNVGDSMLNNITNNYITTQDGFVCDGDAAGIYLDTHWVNPGNYLSCNYVMNSTQCLYLDYASSGTVVDGMICYNSRAGLKLNTGHNNNISSFLNIKVLYPGWISCQNYDINNCLSDPGSYWDKLRVQSYNSPAIQKNYPYLIDFCNQTKINNISCNPNDGRTPPANVTGACSGIPTGNKVEIVNVDSLRVHETPFYKDCGPTINPATKLNSLRFNNPPFNHSSVYFKDFDNLDLSPKSNSTIFTKFPFFRSCPKSANGPQPVDPAKYALRFNIAAGTDV